MSTPLLVASPHLNPAAHTPIAYVNAVVWAYQQRGLSPLAALQAAQIAPQQLDDPAARITALQMEQLCQHAMQELDDEALGWFSRALPWGSYGLLARASISSPSLGLAIARWCRHHGLLTADATLQLVVQGQTAHVRMQLHRELGAIAEFCTVSVLRNLHGLASWLVDARVPVRAAQFPFAAPPHREVYARLFGAPVQFEAGQAGLELDAQWLQVPVLRDEAALNAMLQRALPIQVRPYSATPAVVQRVRQALAAHPQCGHTAASLAEQLHMAPRSLHRQLDRHGSSVQQLKDDVRRQRATHLLQRTDMPLKRIAQVCGYASEKSFIRAFHAWTGLAPGAYRQAQQPARGAQ